MKDTFDANRFLLRTAGLGTAALALAAAGCGDDEGGEGFQEEVFSTVALRSLNGYPVTGAVSFTEDYEQDVFSVAVDAVGLAEDALHPQHVHAAARCPTDEADVNDDGFVDVVEGVPDYGGILIPLDGDLSDQEAGMPEGYPTADGDGTVDYDASTPLSAMVDDLRTADPESPLTGLEGTELSLLIRTVVLHGIAETSSTTLPSTVQSFGDTPAYLTIPVACGIVEIAVVE